MGRHTKENSESGILTTATTQSLMLRLKSVRDKNKSMSDEEFGRNIRELIDYQISTNSDCWIPRLMEGAVEFLEDVREIWWKK
jgi:hypothetical protein